MYVPSHFRITDRDEIERFIAENAFGTLVTTGDALPHATHLPFLVERRGEATILRAHVARANPQWRSLNGSQVFAIFLGPHDYVSPRWYASRDNVPTWDYMAVHVYGVARLVEERDDVLSLLTQLAERYEGVAGDAWRVGDVEPSRLEGFLQAIVAFEIEVTNTDASFKLSQNRTSRDRAGVTEALRASGNTELAEAIERYGPRG